MEEFNEIRQLEKFKAGFKGGTFFVKPNLAPSMNFEDTFYSAGYTDVKGKLNGAPVQRSTPMDVWIKRRPNSSM
jgi:hypothetical protein